MVYVILHGETDGNLTRTLRGKVIDDELNGTGIEQAKTVANELKDVKIDVCYCSPMKRTIQTCDIIFQGPVFYDERLLPRDYGELIGKNSKTDFDAESFWNRKIIFPSEGVEQILDFEKRVFEFLNEVTVKHKDENVLIVTHASVTFPIKTFFQGMPEDDNYFNIPLTKNCEILKFDNKRSLDIKEDFKCAALDSPNNRTGLKRILNG